MTKYTYAKRTGLKNEDSVENKRKRTPVKTTKPSSLMVTTKGLLKNL